MAVANSFLSSRRDWKKPGSCANNFLDNYVMNSISRWGNSARFSEIQKRTTELGRLNFQATGLCSIGGGGEDRRPKLALVFMNPTRRNVSSQPHWRGLRFPFIGIFRIWSLFSQCQLLDEAVIQNFNKPAATWSPDDALLLEKHLREKKIYITNVVKETSLDSRRPKPAVFKRYQALLHDEMEAVQPQLIIAFGLDAYKALTATSIKLEDVYQKTLAEDRLFLSCDLPRPARCPLLFSGWSRQPPKSDCNFKNHRSRSNSF